MRRGGLFFTAVLVFAAGHASAAGIDLSKPYGNKSGCINRNGQEVYAEDMLLLTSEAFVTATSACSFTGTKSQPDGSLVVKADCEAEGEDGKSPGSFTIKHSAQNAKKLVIADEDGTVYGEVSLCR
jgi:hypothetical protein